MSRFRSKCGYLMVMQTGEEAYEHFLLPDNSWTTRYYDFVHKLPKSVQRHAHQDDAFDAIDSLILDTAQRVLRCPNCGRIYVDVEGNNTYSIFKPESWEE